MTTVYNPSTENIVIEHLDNDTEIGISRFQMIQLLYVLYSDGLRSNRGTPTGYFNLHLSDKRKSKKFWRTFFNPYLEEIFPREIPSGAEKFRETLKND